MHYKMTTNDDDDARQPFYCIGEEIVLTTDHLQSAFIIFCFGILLSSFIFIMEIIAAQPWTQKKLNLIRKRGKKCVHREANTATNRHKLTHTKQKTKK